MDKDGPNPVDATDEQVRLLLMLYRCPSRFTSCVHASLVQLHRRKWAYRLLRW
jgi:hypothetical protein